MAGCDLLCDHVRRLYAEVFRVLVLLLRPELVFPISTNRMRTRLVLQQKEDPSIDVKERQAIAGRIDRGAVSSIKEDTLAYVGWVEDRKRVGQAVASTK